jgi:gliding motility-associated-like protein
MKNSCLSFLGKGKVLLLLTILLSANRLNAQTDTPIGTGSAGNGDQVYPCPLQDWYEGSRAQYLYRASELTAGGMNAGFINAIKFNVLALNAYAGDIQDFTVKIGTTSSTTLSTSSTVWEPANTTVFGPVNYTVVSGINTITFSSPFLWNGTDNIVIEICNGLATNASDGIDHYTENPTIPWTTTLGFNGSHTIAVDNGGNLCGSTVAGAAITSTPTNRPNIIFNWTPNVACTDPPTAGTVTASANPVCNGTNFSLTTTGSSFGTGQTYRWQSSADNTTWTDIPGGTISAINLSQTAATFYRLIITCGTGSDTTNALQVGSLICYCNSIPTAAANEDILSVTVNGTTNTSDCFTPGPGPGSILSRYANYHPRGALVNLIAGITVDFSIEVGECDAPSAVSHGCAIWIDFNHDGDFTDAGEQVYVDNAVSPNPRTVFGNITVPNGALPGPTAMRIIVAQTFSGAGLQPCMTYTNGETEDYLINIIPPTPCSGPANAGASSASPTSACVGQTITLSNAGTVLAMDQSYQWELSTDNGATWSVIPGATAFTVTTSQPAATTLYRFRVTCDNTGDISYSTVAQVSTPPIPVGVYTIDKNESNSANIFPNGRVFTSFNSAYDAMKCGIGGAVTINVLAGSGPYNEQLIMNGIIPNSSSANTITFNGNGETITFATTATERAVIKIKNIQYIRFENLVIVPTGASNGYGVHLTGDANFNIIRSCTVNTSTTATTTNYAGIAISGSETDAIGTTTTATLKCDFNEILNNTINGGYYGMTLAASFTNGAHGNNKFYGNKVNDFYQYGLYVTGTFITTVDSNFFSRPTRTNAPADVHGIYFTGQSNSSVVTRNRITNPFGANLAATASFNGINFNGTTATSGFQNTVSNNLIYKTNGNGPINGINNAGSGNVWYIHNTVSIDSLNTLSAATRGFSMNPAANGLVFFDNNISLTRNGPGAKHVIYLAGLQINSDYNNFYRSVSGATGGLGYYTTDRATLGAWQTATSQDAHSVSADPVFTNVNDGIAGYTPGNGGLNNQGLYFGINQDILGVTRPVVNPDIGAYEFNPPACTLPPVNGTTNIIPVGPVCQQTFIQLDLNIGPYGSGQTFQWQSSTTPTGPWTNIGNPKFTPDTSVQANATLYYRAIVSCGASIDSSNAVQIVVTPALPAGTYTINKDLPTDYVAGVSGPGANFASFNAAKAAMVECGILGPVVFNVGGTGDYLEQLKLDSIKNTSSVNTVTFNGNGKVIRFAIAPTNTERAVIKLNSTDHIIFNNLTIDAATGGFGFGYGVQLINNADSNTFRNCTILTSTTSNSQNYNGVVINSADAGSTTLGNTLCDDNLFEGNTITGGFYGATIVGGNGSTNPLILGNQFIGNTIQEFYSAGLYIAGTFNHLIEGNTITRPTRTSIASPSQGILVTGATSQRLRISKNRITKLFGGVPTTTTAQYGIYFNAASAPAGNDNIVSNNVIYDLVGNGIIYGIFNTGSDGVRYYHNTISLDNLSSTATVATRGFSQVTAAVGLEFYNNIISIRRGGTGPKHGIYLETAASEVVSDRNDFYIDGFDGNNHVGFNGANRTTLADWQAARPDDNNSFSINPLFKDPATGDYSPGLQTINDAGIWVNITTDILNAPRNPLTPDIGAYEFTPLPCVEPPTAGTASVTPSTNLCLETRIELNLTGHSPLGSLTFQWQSATTAAGPWTTISPVLYTPQFFTTVGSDTMFRAMVICANGAPVYSNIIEIDLAPVVFAGTYTIDNSQPTTWPGPPGSNFNTFNAAVSAMTCGITGPVIFNVRPGTTAGVYNEQVSIPYIKNSSAVNTITFQSENGNAASINLTYSSSAAPTNYTLRLDSVKYVTFRNLTISATNASFGRAVELSKGASYNTLYRCIINAPVASANSNSVAGVYANGLKGVSNIIRNNAINNGSMGIYFWGTGVAADLTADHLIDSNIVTGAYSYGINANFLKRAKLTNNTVNTISTGTGNHYGIYASDCDSSYTISGNKVNISNAARPVYGIYLNNSDTALGLPRALTANTVTGVTGNSSPLYGIYINNSPGHEALNNVITLNTSSTTTYGLYATNIIKGKYFNNSVNITSPSGAGTNTAAYFNTVGSPEISIRNNIFSNKGSGRAMYVTNASRPFGSDYNMLYAAGSAIVQSETPALTYSTLQAWKTTSYWDKYSIVYRPAFVSDEDLHPNLNNPDVWAMHGRGVQIPGNDKDFNNNPRPTTLTTGVPDLGAFEFVPTSLPTLLTPVPAGAPAPGLTQAFLYGTDTVTRITWGANVPPTAGVRRYSGVVPSNLTGPDSMYFYTQVETPGDYNYSMDLFYLDPWQGSIPEQWQIGLGRTTPGGAWVVGFNSLVTPPAKRITQTDLTYMNKFTGLINPFAPPVLPDKDSSNRGRRFWVAYAINQLRTGANQEMVLYLSAQEPANVSVKINGTSWQRDYLVPANTVVQTEFLPKDGPDNAFLNNPGLSERGIYIESDVPIVVYAHATGSASSGAAMLLPVSVWGYEYKTLGITQNYGGQSYSYFYAVADKDNTTIEITPTVPVQNPGMTPGVPYIVTLNKGEVFQVVATSQTQELTGSTVKSIPNSNGVCQSVAVFSGTSRSALNIGCGSGGDFMMQQNFPATAWGKHYLTAPSSESSVWPADPAVPPTINSANLQTNVYRIAVRDPATVVKKNGVVMTGLINGHYYQYQSNTADYIESDRPIMVAQYLTGACDGVGDPEMIYISPIEQGIDNIGFYRNSRENIKTDLLTLIIPTNGLPSLEITDGFTTVTPDYVYDHPQNGTPSLRGVQYSVVVKSWQAGQQQVRVHSDSSFTAITYGLGSVESYGYNAGTLVKNINATGTINNTLNTSGGDNDFTCVGSPFTFSATLQLKPTKLTFKLSGVPNLTPNADVTILNPVAVDSFMVNWTTFYVFTIPNSYTFSQPGIYPVQIVYQHPDIEGCDHEGRDVTYVQVVPAPVTDFNIDFTGCVGGTAQFTGEPLTTNGLAVSQWQWTFHNGTGTTGQTTSFTYPSAGSYQVNLHTVTPDGCIGDSTKTVVVNPKPTVDVLQDQLTICAGSDATFTVANPVAGVNYVWYYLPTGGTPIDTTTTFTVSGLTAYTEFYVEAVTDAGCASDQREKVSVDISIAGAAPVVSVMSTGSNFVTFSWAAIPGSAGYQVSTDGGTTWINPSSGATGLTHTVSPLGNLQTVTLIVKSLNSCGEGISQPVSGCSSTPVQVVDPALSVCEGANATFNVQSPVAGVNYSWYNSLTGGMILGTGSSFTFSNVTGSATLYVEQQLGACIGAPRTPVVVSVLPPLGPITATVDSIGVNVVRFRWNAVPGAGSYQVSIDGGTTFITPSSGPTGLTHTIGGLQPAQEVTLIVKAIGTITCQESISQVVKARTWPDDIYIPNAFTPNGDGLNDVFRVYGYIVQEQHVMVFNQWGAKIFESRDQSVGWDGTHSGKPQPSGVYIVIGRFILRDGTLIERKTALNLIR